MLYYLFEWLHKLNFPGAGMFGYTSFRALMAVILALLISSIWGDKFINLLKKKQITETQRDAKTDPFGVNKVGVPSMGGVIIIIAILIPCLLLGKLENIYMILMLITTIWLGSLGFADDYIKIFKKDKEGLHGKFKIIGQVGLGLIVGLTLYLSPDVVIRENIEVHTPGQEMEVIHGTNDLKSTQTTIPFFKSNNLDYADLVAFMGEHAQSSRMDTVRHHHHLRSYRRFQRCEPERRNGRNGGRKFRHHRCHTWNISLCVIAYRICELSEYHVYPRLGGTGYLHLCLYRCAYRFPLVQCLSGTGFHGRYRQSDNRRHHRRIRHHYPQRAADTDSLRCIPCGEPVGHPATGLL